MNTDKRLQEAALAMVAAGQHERSVLAVLKEKCPHIYAQVVKDRSHPGILAAWGRSANVDENTGQTIVPPVILQAIGKLARVPMRGRFVHAGLTHTYGYLFSLIDTPYGRKRDRWITTELEEGFGLERSLLGDNPHAGTLLANATWFLARIALRKQPRFFRSIDKNAVAVASEIVRLDYNRLKVTRVVEHIQARRKGGGGVYLLTDLVPFPHAPVGTRKENVLLVYSVQTSVRPRLITAFPVTSSSAAEIIATAERGPRERVRLRYNAYVPGLFGRDLWGRCFLDRDA